MSNGPAADLICRWAVSERDMLPHAIIMVKFTVFSGQRYSTAFHDRMNP